MACVAALALALTISVTPPTIECAGDCNGDRIVSVSELVGLVASALGEAELVCFPGDLNRDGQIKIWELVSAVSVSLGSLKECAPPTETPTPPPTATPSAEGAFGICGSAGERPGLNAPLARFVTVTLKPLDVTAVVSSSGIFCFEDVPPGSYTLSVREYPGATSHCTEYGCWGETPVTVVDSDVLHVFIVMQPLPPTPTPTSTKDTCTYRLMPPVARISGCSATINDQSGSVSVLTNLTTCCWRAESLNTVLQIVSASSGCGDGDIAYSVPPNTTSSELLGRIVLFEGTGFNNVGEFALQISRSCTRTPTPRATPGAHE